MSSLRHPDRILPANPYVALEIGADIALQLSMNNLASLSAETLASLAPPTDSKNDLVQSFVESQKAHAKAYAKEGRNFASTWDCSTPERQLDDALPLDKSAFATPVLKPRVARPEIHSELDQSISALSIRNSDESPHRVGPHQKRQISSKAKKQNQQLLITSTGKENNAEQKASKRIDEQQEHAASELSYAMKIQKRERFQGSPNDERGKERSAPLSSRPKSEREMRQNQTTARMDVAQGNGNPARQRQRSHRASLSCTASRPPMLEQLD